MAKVVKRTEDDDLVLRARTQADALGRLYELYYERIFRFCVHRLFDKEIAEDVTSAVFLEVAQKNSQLYRSNRAGFWKLAVCHSRQSGNRLYKKNVTT